MDEITIDANGLRYTARVAGPDDGEPVLFLHGFPDTAATFDHQLDAFGDAGFRAIAPTMRGYEPSSQPSDGDHTLLTLAGDVVGWLDALGVDRAHVVGHDWGAATAYLVASHHGDRCHSVTAMAVPPLPRLPTAVRRVPKQLLLSWYMTFFQLPFVPERAVQARDWALLRWFWRRWSPGLEAPSGLVEAFEQSGVLRSSLAYYRQNAAPPELLGVRPSPATELRPAEVPVMIVHGDRDGCMDARMFDHTVVDDDYPLGLRYERIGGTGHFLHVEAPDRVTALLLDWVTSYRSTPGGAG